MNKQRICNRCYAVSSLLLFCFSLGGWGRSFGVPAFLEQLCSFNWTPLFWSKTTKQTNRKIEFATNDTRSSLFVYFIFYSCYFRQPKYIYIYICMQYNMTHLHVHQFKKKSNFPVRAVSILFFTFDVLRCVCQQIPYCAYTNSPMSS